MRIVYGLGVLLAAILIAHCAICSFKKHDRLGKSVCIYAVSYPHLDVYKRQAYIPTNVISITDGQIFLESNLFNAGMRPAVNVGLSVSRVGGAAQTKAMKKASGSIRIDLAQYREMEVFTQFASDLDDATKAQLAHGKALMELLKQPLCHPLSLHEQVMTLIMANHGVFDTIETKDVKKYQGDIDVYKRQIRFIWRMKMVRRAFGASQLLY